MNKKFAGNRTKMVYFYFNITNIFLKNKVEHVPF